MVSDASPHTLQQIFAVTAVLSAPMTAGGPPLSKASMRISMQSGIPAGLQRTGGRIRT